MYNDGEYFNEEEHTVITEAGEDIELVFKFACVEFIEHLQEYEDIEEHGKEYVILRIPVFVSKRLFILSKSEDGGASE